MEKHRFTIKIKGFATYNPNSLQLPIGKYTDVKKFKDEVERLLSEHYAIIKDKLDKMTPVKMNPIIDGEFFFDGVEDEA